MSEKTPKIANRTDQDVLVVSSNGSGAAAPKRARVKVGGVVVVSEKASPAQMKRAVTESTDMLERLGRKIARPGFRLKAVRDIPLFSADPDDPNRFLRKLNGKVERGVLENGDFKVVD